jgi:hypothetical protein
MAMETSLDFLVADVWVIIKVYIGMYYLWFIRVVYSCRYAVRVKQLLVEIRNFLVWLIHGKPKLGYKFHLKLLI